MASKFRYVLINSADRIDGTSSSFTCTFNPSIQAPRSIRLLNLSIPNTVYNVTTSNDTIYWRVAGVDYMAIIPSGSYNSTTILSALSNAMNIIYPVGLYIATYDTTTFKISISSVSNFQFMFGTNTAASLGPLIGFTVDTVNLSVQTGNNVIQLSSPLFYYINMDGFPFNVISTNKFDQANFIVSSTVNSGSLQTFNLLSNFVECGRYYDQNISELHVSLSTSGNQSIDLNGSEWCFLLEFSY